MDKSPILFTRKDLYDQVWSEPMSRLAVKYEISDVGLKKICNKMGIPTPVSGHWAKIKAGHKAERIPLPEFDKSKYVESYNYIPSTETKQSPTLPDEYASKLSPIKNLSVPEHLTTRNPLVLEAKRAYKSARTDDYGMAWPEGKVLHLRVSPLSVDRALRIMDTILKGFTELDFKVENEGNERGTYALVFGEKVHFSIEEKVKRSDHVLTEKEKAHNKQDTYSIAPRWDFHPTGILSLVIIDSCGVSQKRWKDGSTKTEDHLVDFFRNVMASAIALREQKIRWQEQKMKWEEEQQREAEELQKQKDEQLKCQQLENQAAMWSRSQVLRSYIKQVEQIVSSQKFTEDIIKRFEEWKSWAIKHADRIDPLHQKLPFIS